MRNNLKALRRVLARLAAAHPIKGDVAKSDAVRSYFGLLTLGNSDFDAIENYRGDAFFKTSLGITLLPSSLTLLQRMDAKTDRLLTLLC